MQVLYVQHEGHRKQIHFTQCLNAFQKPIMVLSAYIFQIN